MKAYNPYNMLALAIVSRAQLDLKQSPSTICGGDRRPLEEIRAEAESFLVSKWGVHIIETVSMPRANYEEA